MWLRAALVPFAVLLTTANADSPCNPKACSRLGSTNNEKVICGSDGLSYPNRCHFERTRCIHRNLTISKRGPCRLQKPCKDWDSYRQSHAGYRFEANCRPDGSYAAAQCNPDSGFCWCVTPQGIPQPYTSMRWKPNQKARCGRKKSTRRRSPIGKVRPCKQIDKIKFNNNLLNIFHTEYERYSTKLKHTNETDRIVNQWKFRALDINNDGYLDKQEYASLKKLTKKAVKPKRCAKVFPRTCDFNSDTRIGQQEWVECLTRDGMDDTEPGVDTTSILVDRPSLADDNEESSNGNRDDDDDAGGNPFLLARPLPNEVLNYSQYEDESSEIREDDPDCNADRNAALLLVDGNQFYVPECTPDGRYKKIQCYKAAGYCFCVSEDTGKNIPGTSVYQGTPKCDTDTNRTMKGCPDERKMTFLRELFEFLHTRMRDSINDTKNLNSLPWMSSKEEQIATWSFVVFDRNKNKMLERNEWKAFKELVANVKGLKKCGKKLPRYCDSNKDRHISMTEWLSCLNVQQASMSNITPASSRAGKKNPLDVLLQD